MVMTLCAMVSCVVASLAAGDPASRCEEDERCHQEWIIGEHCPIVAIAADTGRLYVVYQNAHFIPNCKYSDDRGQTWTGPITISEDEWGHRLHMVVDGAGGVYVAWYKEIHGEDTSEIWWSYSLDHGDTWMPESLVSEPGVFCYNPKLAVHRSDSGDITVKVLYWSMLDYPDAQGTLQYRWTLDLGQTWSEVVNIDRAGGRFAIKMDPNPLSTRVHLAYLHAPGGEAYYVSETEDHGVFGEPVNVSRNPEGFSSQTVTLALPRNPERYMVWPSLTQAHDEELLRMSSSEDFGQTWSEPSNIRDDGYGYRFPKLLAHRAGPEQETLYLVAIQQHPGPLPLAVFMKSLDSGQTWTEPFDLSPTEAPYCANPTIAHGAGHFLAVTMMAGPEDLNELSHIFITLSPDGGSTWSEPLQLTGLGSLIPFDSDGDGDVDVKDFATFQACYTGPCVDTPCDPPLYDLLDPPVGNCQCMDADDDGDVDVDDFEILPRLFGGPG